MSLRRIIPGFAALLLLAAPLLRAQQPPSYPKGGPRRPGPMMPFSKEEREKARVRMGISLQQQEQLDALFAEVGKKGYELGTKMREVFQQQRALYDNYDLDRSRDKAFRKEIANLHAQMLQNHAETEEKLRRIMTREQFERMRVMMNEAQAKRREGRKGWGREGEGGPPPGPGKP